MKREELNKMQFPWPALAPSAHQIMPCHPINIILAAITIQSPLSYCAMSLECNASWWMDTQNLILMELKQRAATSSSSSSNEKLLALSRRGWHTCWVCGSSRVFRLVGRRNLYSWSEISGWRSAVIISEKAQLFSSSRLSDQPRDGEKKKKKKSARGRTAGLISHADERDVFSVIYCRRLEQCSVQSPSWPHLDFCCCCPWMYVCLDDKIGPLRRDETINLGATNDTGAVRDSP